MATQDPGFTIQSRPCNGTILAGRDAVFTVVWVRTDEVTDPAQLSVTGLPAGASASFVGNFVTGGWAISNLTIKTSITTPVGSYPLTISAIRGGVAQTSTVQLDIVPALAFTHPGVLLNASQLARMAAKVNEQASPWHEAFIKAKQSKFGSLSYKPKPMQAVDTGNTTQTAAVIDDSEAAYTQALLWYITQNPDYAENAIRIMHAWAETFTGSFTGNNYLNVAAWTGDNWPRAAEIIRCTFLKPDGSSRWGDAGIDAFKSFLARVYIPLVTQARTFGYFGGNLNAASAAASINIGVFNDDPQTFLTGIWIWRHTLPAYIYMSSDGPLPVPPANWSAANSIAENVKALWRNQSPLVDGLCQETCRDLGHVLWGFAALANGAETAYLQGFDLYAESSLGTSNAQRLQAGLEFNATYLLQAPPAWLCRGSIVAGSSAATGEIAYNALVNRRGLSLPKLDAYLSLNRPTNAGYFINWETLTHFANP